MVALPCSHVSKLAKAEKVIRDLLKYGEHPGKCTNVLKNGERDRLKACKKHLAAVRRREKSAIKFVSSISGI